MNCIEVIINGKVFRLVKEGITDEQAVELPSQNSDGSQPSYEEENELLRYFISTGGHVPDGYLIETESETGLTKSDYEHLSAELQKAEENQNNVQQKRSLALTGDYKEFVNKLIGNGSMSRSDFYQDKNILVCTYWGNSKAWFGFTEQRFVAITGNTYKTQEGDSTFKFLNEIHREVKDGNVNTIRLINQLYQGTNQSADIYEKLTWVANSRLPLLKKLKWKFTIAFKSKDELQNALKRKDKSVIGKFFVRGSSTLVISSFDKGSQIKCQVLYDKTNPNAIGKEIIIDRYEISTLYYPREVSVSINNKTISGISYGGNIWLKRDSKGHLKPEKNQKNIDALSSIFYGDESELGEFIDTSKYKLKANDLIQVNPETKSLILDLLSSDDSIITSNGIIRKTDTNEFQTLEGTPVVLGDANILAIHTNNRELLDAINLQYPNLDSKIIRTRGEMNCIVTKFLGNQHLETTQYGNIKFGDMRNDIIKIVWKEDQDGQQQPVLQIAANFESSAENIRRLYAVLRYWAAYQSGQLEDVQNIATTWEKLYDHFFKNTDDGKDEAKQGTRTRTFQEWRSLIINENDSDSTINDEWNEIIRTDKADNIISDINTDELLQMLIDKGMLIYACEV